MGRMLHWFAIASDIIHHLVAAKNHHSAILLCLWVCGYAGHGCSVPGWGEQLWVSDAAVAGWEN